LAGLTKPRHGLGGTSAAWTGHDDMVDVSAVEGALRCNHAVATSNAGHIRKAAVAAAAKMAIHAIGLHAICHSPTENMAR